MRRLALALGIFLLVGLVRKLGWQTISENLLDFGWYFVGVVAIYLLGITAHAGAWYQTFRHWPRRPSFGRVWLVKIGGEAVNTVTPASFVGGDPFRVYLLPDDIPGTEAAPGVIIDRTLFFIASIAFILVGLIALLVKIAHLPAHIKFGVPIFVVLASGFMVFVFVAQRRGLFGWIMKVLQVLRIKRTFSAKTIDRFTQMDQRIIDFYTTQRNRFWLAIGLHLLGRFGPVFAIYYIGKLMDPSFGFFAALILSAMTTLVNFAFALIPGSVGVMEGAYGGASFLMGMDPALGVSIQLIRRIRSLFSVALGFSVIGILDRQKSRRRNELSAASSESNQETQVG